MCNSQAEGGQRCYGHTKTALDAAETRYAALTAEAGTYTLVGQDVPPQLCEDGIRARYDKEDALARYASTPKGATDLTARMDALTVDGQAPAPFGKTRDAANEFHNYAGALSDGRQLRVRAKEVFDAVKTGAMTPDEAKVLVRESAARANSWRTMHHQWTVPAARQSAPTGNTGPTRADRDAATAMIPRQGTLTDYYEATDRKHFGPGATPGSTFTDPTLTTLDDVVALTSYQRTHGLSGNDHARLLALGAPAEALTPGTRYLLVNTPGQVNMARSENLPDTTTVRITRTKPGTPCSIIWENQPGTPTTYGTVIIGPNPTNPAQEVVYTAHPGLPSPTDRTDRMAPYEGQNVTLAQVRAAYHGDIWLTTQPPA